MEILPAEPQDAEDILELTKLAFAPVAEEYGQPTLPPLEETLDDLRAQFRTHMILKAVDERGRIVGAVRGVMWRGTCEIGRLVVRPECQGRGTGTALAREIERCFPDARRFELFTGQRSGPSLHIYAKLGYAAMRVERVDDRLQLLYLEKPGPAAGRSVSPRAAPLTARAGLGYTSAGASGGRGSAASNPYLRRGHPDGCQDPDRRRQPADQNAGRALRCVPATTF